MRKFRFVGDPSEYRNWDKMPAYGDVFDREMHHKYYGDEGSYDVFDNILEDMDDFEEVFDSEEPTKPLYKDTDLGYYAGIYIQTQIVHRSGNPDIKWAITQAKELIKQLNEETK